MTVGSKVAPSSPAELLGDTHPLLDQLGSSEDIAATSTVTDAMELNRVTDVSSLLGYSSISHFSTAFKKHTGLKPCELLFH